MRKFAIITGRWYGVWSWIWYADIMHESEDIPYTSFNALTKRGALRKAKRHIRRLVRPIEERQGTVYVYDENILKTEKIEL